MKNIEEIDSFVVRALRANPVAWRRARLCEDQLCVINVYLDHIIPHTDVTDWTKLLEGVVK